MKNLTELERMLYDRLKECHKAMDTSTDLMEEQGLSLESTEMYEVLVGEMAATETLLITIEDYNT
tara:strand:+ start:518 stop:712 length:195 start_codon:yes stop_codon:yes gene_type:complete